MGREQNVKLIVILYILLALLGGGFFAFINPLGQEFGGEAAFAHAYDVSLGNILEPFITIGHERNQGRLPADYYDREAYELQSYVADGARGRLHVDIMKQYPFDNGYIYTEDDRVFASFYYYPQAIGLGIARLFNTSVWTATVLGHLCNLFVYVLITTYALCLMPVARHFCMAVMASPLALYIASSFSPMSLLFALSFLYIAVIMHMAIEMGGYYQWWHSLLLGVLLLALYMYDFPMLMFVALIFVLPKGNFDSRESILKGVGLFLAPLMVYVLHQAIFTGFFPMGKAIGTSPFYFIEILMPSIYAGISNFYITWGIMGDQRVALVPLMYILPLVWIAVLSMDFDDEGVVTLRYRMMAGISFTLMFVGTLFSLYCSYGTTMIGEIEAVSHLDSRYFVGAMPLLGILFVPKKVYHEVRCFTQKVALVTAILLGWAIYVYYIRMYTYGFDIVI